MKSTTTLILTSLLSSTAFSSVLLPRIDASNYVYKPPFSFNGTCHTIAGSAGSCRVGKLGAIQDFPCLISRCDDNKSICTVAYAADGTEKAKCATNLVDYDWVWPYIDEDTKTKVNTAGQRRYTVDTCMKTAQKDLDGAASDGMQIAAAQEVFKCYNDKLVLPAGRTGKDAVSDARKAIKNVSTCVKAADGAWYRSGTDIERKNIAVALVTCYDTLFWN